MRLILLLVILAMLSACGGGGGDASENGTAPPDTSPVEQKVSAIDGSWRIETMERPSPQNAWADPLFLGIYHFVKFENGMIKCVTSTAPVILKTGPFSFNGGTLQYTFTEQVSYSERYQTNPFTGKSEKFLIENKSEIYQPVWVTVTGSSSYMAWTDASGNRIATLTK